MKLNDFNKKLKEEYKDNLDLNPVKKPMTRRKKILIFTLTPAIALTSLIILFVATLFIDQAIVNAYNNGLYKFDYVEASDLIKVNNKSELKPKYDDVEYRTSIIDNLSEFFDGFSVKTSYDDATAVATSSEDSGYANDSSSEGGSTFNVEETSYETNVQVEGVDEATIAKCDGTYIYYLYKTGSYSQGFYDNRYLILVIYDLSGNKIVNQKIDVNINVNYDYSYYYYGASINEAQLYVYNDTIIIETADTVLIYEFKDSAITLKYYSSFKSVSLSRLLDNNYYFVGAMFCSSTNLEYENLYYDGYSNPYYIYRLYKLNLDTLDIEVVDLVDSKSSYCYMNYDYIVIASYEYYDDNVVTLLKVFDHDLNTLGMYAVKGRVYSNLAIDIKDTYLRVVTTDVCSKPNQVNALSIYDLNERKRTSIINKGLGEDYEEVKSVTYNNDTCFVVTFEVTDPLYEIDLTDPYKPKIVDEYKAPGYSDYLKTFTLNGETYIIGIGQIDFNDKISVYKDLDKNVQIGEDYVISDFRYLILDRHYTAYFFYASEAENAIYFGAQCNSYYVIYKIDVLTGNVTKAHEVDTSYNTRCFLVNSKFYIPTPEELVIINY